MFSLARTLAETNVAFLPSQAWIRHLTGYLLIAMRQIHPHFGQNEVNSGRLCMGTDAALIGSTSAHVAGGRASAVNSFHSPGKVGYKLL
jgi:hypothetical protein